MSLFFEIANDFPHGLIGGEDVLPGGDELGG